MKRMGFAILGTLACLSFISSSPAAAEEGILWENSVMRGGPRPPGGSVPYVDGDTYYGGYDDTFTDATFDLMLLFSLAKRKSNSELVRVEVAVRNPEGHSGGLSLFINGLEEDETRFIRDFNSLEVRGNRLINQDIHRLQLRINGSAIIKTIKIVLRDSAN